MTKPNEATEPEGRYRSSGSALNCLVMFLTPEVCIQAWPVKECFNAGGALLLFPLLMAFLFILGIVGNTFRLFLTIVTALVYGAIFPFIKNKEVGYFEMVKYTWDTTLSFHEHET